MNNQRILFFSCIAILLLSCGSGNTKEESQFWTEKESPEYIGYKISKDLFTRGEFMMYINDEITTFHYAEACAAYGLTRFAGLKGDTNLLSKIIGRYGKVVSDGLISDVGHVDVNVYGILPLEIYIQTKNEAFLKEGIHLADLQWESPLPNGMTKQTRYWIDDVYMIASLQVQAFRATGNDIYLDRAALEVDDYLKKLQQENGLFHHGQNAPFFWGRGNGWVAAGVAELISELPKTNQYYTSILTGYKKMMEALLNYQSEEGMWRQLIDNEESWLESSSTAMFGYALSEGVKRGILEDPAYTKAYQKAWLALCNYVDENGKLTEVCVGTGQSLDINYYLQRPKVSGDYHGQAPMLWFASSLLEMQE